MEIPIAQDIFYAGVNDHRTALFEELWPLPHGISYNAYLIRDEKVALIDAVKKDFFGEFEAGIRPLLAGGRKIDYLIINHIEPDHSGALQALLERYPDLCVVGNEKTLQLLRALHPFPVQTRSVKDGETLSLGKHTLEFFVTPMVHWPETMMTYDRATKVLFTGDMFGSFGALPGKIFDDEVDLPFFLEEARRYFANVLGKYTLPQQKAFARIEALDIGTIASTHGPVYRKDPRRIRDLYGRWSRYETEPGVVIAYASMYENTKKMAEAIAASLAGQGVREIRMHSVSQTHLSFILSDIWRFRGLILAACTYNTRPFPMMELLMNFLENDRVGGHVLGLLGSYGWANAALPALKDFSGKGTWQLVEPVIDAQGAPTPEILNQCAQLGENMARALKQAGTVEKGAA